MTSQIERDLDRKLVEDYKAVETRYMILCRLADIPSAKIMASLMYYKLQVIIRMCEHLGADPIEIMKMSLKKFQKKQSSEQSS